MSSAWNVVARLMLQGKRAELVRTRPAEFTATNSIARGQLCIVDLEHGTVSPATTRSRADQLEKDLS